MNKTFVIKAPSLDVALYKAWQQACEHNKYCENDEVAVGTLVFVGVSVEVAHPYGRYADDFEPTFTFEMRP